MRHPAIVARRRHAIMPAQRVVAAGQVRPGVGVEVAEGSRQAVAAMLGRRATYRPERVLQPLGERDMAFAAQYHMRVLEARPDEPEMVEPVIEDDAGDGDAELGHVGEVRQRHPPGRVHLTEDHLLLLAVKRSPRADAPLERPPYAGVEVGMASAHLLENRDRAQTGGRFEQRHDLGIENVRERIGSPSPARHRLHRGQPRIAREPIRRRGAEPGLRRRDRDAVTVSKPHIQPHLMIVDVAAGHARLPLPSEEASGVTRPTAIISGAPRRERHRQETRRLRAMPSAATPPADSHPDCRRSRIQFVAQHARFTPLRGAPTGHRGSTPSCRPMAWRLLGSGWRG